MKKQDPHREHPIMDFIEEEESKLVKFLKRAGIIFLALMMIGLMLSFVIPYTVLDSLLASQPLAEDPPDYVLQLPNATIIIEAETYHKLLDHYLENQKYEFKACLTGTKEYNLYIANGIYFPEIIAQTHTSVHAPLCENAIIDLHTHPHLSCHFSDQDLSTFPAVRQKSPDALLALMCDTQRFNFYGY